MFLSFGLLVSPPQCWGQKHADPRALFSEAFAVEPLLLHGTAALQLLPSGDGRLVTARWTGRRIKSCRCAWGNLGRVFEERVSHS